MTRARHIARVLTASLLLLPVLASFLYLRRSLREFPLVKFRPADPVSARHDSVR